MLHGLLVQKGTRARRGWDVPCSVRVIDCSNFSSSSGRERLRDDIELGRDMMCGGGRTDRTIADDN